MNQQVFFTERQVAENSNRSAWLDYDAESGQFVERSADESAACDSPSAGKPRKFVRYLAAKGRAYRLVEPGPASREELCRAHDERYVDDVLAGRRNNGFGNRSQEVAASLPYTCGSLLSAARAVLAGGAIACSPTSGFHHAGYDFGGLFCTFNGLMVAALTLKAEGHVKRVAIIDCDQHFGNGTEDIVERLHCADWCLTTGHRFSGRRSEAYLTALDELLADVLAFSPDLILYQAGADVHVDDPLGGSLTTEEMARRDERVLAAAGRTPLVWNLAGGYQRAPGASVDIEPVLALHLQTFDIASLHQSRRTP